MKLKDFIKSVLDSSPGGVDVFFDIGLTPDGFVDDSSLNRIHFTVCNIKDEE